MPAHGGQGIPDRWRAGRRREPGQGRGVSLRSYLHRIILSHEKKKTRILYSVQRLRNNYDSEGTLVAGEHQAFGAERSARPRHTISHEQGWDWAFAVAFAAVERELKGSTGGH